MVKEYTVSMPIHIFEKGNPNGSARTIKIKLNAQNPDEVKNIVEQALFNVVFSNVISNKDV